MSEQKELALRLEAKRKKLQAELESMKNDISDSAIDKKNKMKEDVEELTKYLEVTRKNFTESIAKKINDFLS